jgi:hypothetical protein
MHWSLVVIAAALALNVYVHRRARNAVAQMEQPAFKVFTFSDLPGWVIQRMSPLRDECLSLGFRDLVCYTRNSTRTNFSCVLQSPDHEINAVIWVSQYRGLMYLLILLQGWRAFRRNVLAEARYGLTTEFPDARRFETSPVEILARAEMPGDLEFLIVSEKISLGEAVQRHREAAREFAGKNDLDVLRVTTQEGFFDMERALMARMARKLRDAS